MWLKHLSSAFQIPLVNADRMMLSVLPEPDGGNMLPPWAQTLRDTDENWMKVAQKGVESFVAQAMSRGVPFAMETVFSIGASIPTALSNRRSISFDKCRTRGTSSCCSSSACPTSSSRSPVCRPALPRAAMRSKPNACLSVFRGRKTRYARPRTLPTRRSSPTTAVPNRALSRFAAFSFDSARSTTSGAMVVAVPRVRLPSGLDIVSPLAAAEMMPQTSIVRGQPTIRKPK